MRVYIEFESEDDEDAKRAGAAVRAVLDPDVKVRIGRSTVFIPFNLPDLPPGLRPK